MRDRTYLRRTVQVLALFQGEQSCLLDPRVSNQTCMKDFCLIEQATPTSLLYCFHPVCIFKYQRYRASRNQMSLFLHANCHPGRLHEYAEVRDILHGLLYARLESTAEYLACLPDPSSLSSMLAGVPIWSYHYNVQQASWQANQMTVRPMQTIEAL